MNTFSPNLVVVIHVDGATVDALLHKMKKKIMHTYILGQIGPLVTDPGTSNEEVTAEMTRAALPVGTKAKADFCQGIEVRCVLLHNVCIFM